MSTIDLIVLAILLKNPLNAYELVRWVKNRRIDRVLKVSEPAIFKSCRRLAKSGYIDGETVREVNVPDKVIYHINQSGRERLYELLTHFAQQVNPYFFDFNTVVWGIDSVAPEQGLQLLKQLQDNLHSIKSGVIEHEKAVASSLPFGARQIVKQYRMTITALVKWIDSVVTDFEAEFLS